MVSNEATRLQLRIIPLIRKLVEGAFIQNNLVIEP